jgi:hypothetical protein
MNHVIFELAVKMADEEPQLVAPMPGPRQVDADVNGPSQAPHGMFTLPDFSNIRTRESIAEDEDANLVAVDNQVLLCTAFKQFVKELGPALKKSRLNASQPVRTAADVCKDYGKKFLKAEQKWFAKIITNAKSTEPVWVTAKDKNAKMTMVANFMLKNNLHGPKIEQAFGTTLSKFSTGKRALLKQALCSLLLALPDIQEKALSGWFCEDGEFQEPAEPMVLLRSNSAHMTAYNDAVVHAAKIHVCQQLKQLKWTTDTTAMVL